MRLEEFLGEDYGKILVAGAAGGIVRWATLRHNWKEGIAAVFIGTLCALYLGPIASPLIEPIIGKLAPNGDADGFAAFFVGLGGISLSGFLIDIITAKALRKKEPDGNDD